MDPLYLIRDIFIDLRSIAMEKVGGPCGPRMHQRTFKVLFLADRISITCDDDELSNATTSIYTKLNQTTHNPERNSALFVLSKLFRGYTLIASEARALSFDQPNEQFYFLKQTCLDKNLHDFDVVIELLLDPTKQFLDEQSDLFVQSILKNIAAIPNSWKVSINRYIGIAKKSTDIVFNDADAKLADEFYLLPKSFSIILSHEQLYRTRYSYGWSQGGRIKSEHDSFKIELLAYVEKRKLTNSIVAISMAPINPKNIAL